MPANPSEPCPVSSGCCPDGVPETLNAHAINSMFFCNDLPPEADFDLAYQGVLTTPGGPTWQGHGQLICNPDCVTESTYYVRMWCFLKDEFNLIYVWKAQSSCDGSNWGPAVEQFFGGSASCDPFRQSFPTLELPIGASCTCQFIDISVSEKVS